MGLRIEDEKTIEMLKTFTHKVIEEFSKEMPLGNAIQILSYLDLLHTLPMQVHNAALLRLLSGA